MSKSLIGKPAPDFTIKASDGSDFTLSTFLQEKAGKGVGIFFFPKAGTSVCDAEACSFEKSYPVVGDTNVAVVGISYNPVDELATWKEKNKISYPILSDVDRKARDAYKVSKVLMGVAEGRATFYIGKDGIVKGVLDGHLVFTSSQKHVDFVTKEAAKDA
ncbi:peroxiredoxin Q [Pseudohyphozyma bogoriensis]|nr:peroxiredoxin Q [Pseudohyphozyma bogoriensis]